MNKPESPQVQAGHISIKPEGTGPRDTLFTFQTQQKRFGGAVGISMAVHAGVLMLLILVARYVPTEVYDAILPDKLSNRIVFLPSPGPGGGGGGGNKMPDPPKPAEIPKTKPPEPVPVTPVEPTPEPQKEPEAVAPVQTLAAVEPNPGALTDNTSDSESRGPTTGGGVGSGSGVGIGTGGPRGFGDGAYRLGNGVQTPVAIREVKPQYTAEAMRAKVQGVVMLNCIVMPDGTVGNVEIVRSLDSSFGLDQEAVKAAKQWRFRPGTRLGEPVPVLVTIELTFTLR
jgi:protein TonB